MAVVTSLVAKITFVVAEKTFSVVVITSSVVKITFIVAKITFKVAVITSPVVKITSEKWHQRMVHKVITNIYTICLYNLHEREVLLLFTIQTKKIVHMEE